MKAPSRHFYKTVLGLCAFGMVSVGLRAASYELHRASTVTLAETANRAYTFSVAETPVNPNDHMNSLGIHSDGYFYTCNVYKGSQLVSTYVIRRPFGFHAQGVKITPLTLLTKRNVMTEIEIDPATGDAVVADCTIMAPAPDDIYGTGIINWRAFDISGM